MKDAAPLWVPTESFIRDSNLSHYASWLLEHKGLAFEDYQGLWQWSVDEPAAFWESLWEYFRIQPVRTYAEVMSPEPMPWTHWFSSSRLNYASCIFRHSNNQRPALKYASERYGLQSLSWKELYRQVACVQKVFQQTGLEAGERVAALLPNIPEAVVSALACMASGAVWSSCAPEFGSESVLDRFRQIEPSILVAVDGYQYQGKQYDRMEVLRELQEQLPSLRRIIVIPYLDKDRPIDLPHSISWLDLHETDPPDLELKALPFEHPLWILYSSGTTGLPKAIVHSHGGMLLEHLKYLHLHNDVRAGEHFFWYTTTGWMMWNVVVASMLLGAIPVLYDGSPAYPDLHTLWSLAESAGIEHFGTSAPFLMSCRSARLDIKGSHDLSQLRSIGSTGAPLSEEGFAYVYEQIKSDVWLCSMSGGTDICTAWVGGCPWEPVYAGDLQCRCLGCAMYAMDPQGHPVWNEVGEMVVTRSMPCMPLYLWNDPERNRYLEAYFSEYPGWWRHGDWILIRPDGRVRILGRSDATLNRQGVRLGTADIYRIVDQVPGVQDALVVNLDLPNQEDFMPLFVVLKPGVTLTAKLEQTIRQHLREKGSPRHVPDQILAVPDIPYTLSGKKLETPIKNLLQGRPLKEVLQVGSLRNPSSLQAFLTWADTWRQGAASRSGLPEGPASVQ